MNYVSTALPDGMSVEGIYTVLRVDYSKTGVGSGEAHDFPEICFISKGAHGVVLNGVKEMRRAGEMTVIAPGTYHKSASHSESTGLIISFESSSAALSDLYNKKLTLTKKQQDFFVSIVEEGLRCFKRRAPGDKLSGMVLKENVEERNLQRLKKQLELFLLDIHTSFIENSLRDFSNKRRADYERVCAFLHENISKNLSLSEIATRNSMSLSKLKILFREMGEGGVVSCFLKMKIELAKEKIREGKMNFSEIADSLGFNSLHYFSRYFKKATGLSPSEFAESIRIK